MLNLWSRRVDLLTNQVGKPEILVAWNGSKLKSGKNHILRKITPFIKSTQIVSCIHRQSIIIILLAESIWFAVWYIIILGMVDGRGYDGQQKTISFATLEGRPYLSIWTKFNRFVKAYMYMYMSKSQELMNTATKNGHFTFCECTQSKIGNLTSILNVHNSCAVGQTTCTTTIHSLKIQTQMNLQILLISLYKY